MGARTDDQWVEDLRGGGAPRERALAELRAILLRGLTRVLKRWQLPGGANTVSLAEDFVQDSLIRILDNLGSFEGRSRFTTWAQKIAVRVALTELRRKRWRDVSLDAPPSADADTRPRDARPEGREPDAARAGASSPHGRYAGPAEQVERADTVGWIKRLMVEELTEKQRTAIRAVAFAGLPLEEVARRMGTNRNALYKLIHDARKRLKARLSQEGVRVEDLLHSMDRE